MRVLVCGGRRYEDREHVFDTLTRIDRNVGHIKVIIHGGQTGADAHGAAWADHNNRLAEEYRADWDNLTHPDAIIRTHRAGKRYDARAGLRRNQRMLDEGKPNLVVAFQGGDGTRDMVNRARRAGGDVQKIPERKKCPVATS